MNEVLAAMIDFERHPFKSKDFQVQCKEKLDASGVLVLSKLLLPSTIKTLIEEANTNEHLAYYCNNSHNVYLRPNDESLPAGHSRNQTVSSSKGCIMDDQVPSESPLKVLYSANEFRDFLCAVLGEKALYKYDDNLSSVNVHYAHEGQELGWHFDNSAFAITLLIQKPKGGGSFEYIRDFRDSGSDEMNYEGVKGLLNGEYTPSVLSIEPGDLVLFRGRNSVHRVTPTEGGRVRILSVLAYNTEPGVQLSESARMTFYGRLN
ncbi:MAG: 2OG-Fe(II) oxygenase [Gammaproteobacteria bacterium]|nr:2OG-Fe(II) oxygenase [Gammaproteobacteria bacterium]